jgi:hypothetical protein
MLNKYMPSLSLVILLKKILERCIGYAYRFNDIINYGQFTTPGNGGTFTVKRLINYGSMQAICSGNSNDSSGTFVWNIETGEIRAKSMSGGNGRFRDFFSIYLSNPAYNPYCNFYCINSFIVEIEFI